jgi:hypothetical protein
MDQWYQSDLLFVCFSLCMSLIRSVYKNLGLKLVDPLKYRSCRAQQQLMGNEKKYYGEGDHFKLLLEEALARQRNKMMDNFTQILQWSPT